MTYRVLVQETARYQIDVEADTAEEACELAEEELCECPETDRFFFDSDGFAAIAAGPAPVPQSK